MRSVRSKDLSLARTTTSPSRPSSACSAALRWSPSPESTLPSTTMATSSATRTRRPRMPAGRSDVFAAGSGASSPEESTLPHPAQRATQTSRKSGRTNQISAERVASFSANGDVPFARPLYKSCHVARPEVAGNHRMPQVQGPPGAQGRRKRAHVPSLPPGLPRGRGLAPGDPARDGRPLHDRGGFARQVLVVLGLAARIGVTGNLELEAGHTRHVEALLGVDQRVRQILQLLVAAGRELVAVGLEAALVLAPLGQKLGVHLLDRLAARAACRRAARLLGQSAKVDGLRRSRRQRETQTKYPWKCCDELCHGKTLTPSRVQAQVGIWWGRTFIPSTRGPSYDVNSIRFPFPMHRKSSVFMAPGASPGHRCCSPSRRRRRQFSPRRQNRSQIG